MSKNKDCKVCAFLAKIDSTPREEMMERGVAGFTKWSRCDDHPFYCIHCTTALQYVADDIAKALGKNGGTPLPRRCVPCRDKLYRKKSNPKSEDQNGDRPVLCIECQESFQYTPHEIEIAQRTHGGTALPKRCIPCRTFKTKHKNSRPTTENANGAVSEASSSVVETTAEVVAADEGEETRDDFDLPVKCCQCKDTFRYTSVEIHRASGKNGGTPLPKRCEPCRALGKRWKEKLYRSASEDGESVFSDHNDASAGSPDRSVAAGRKEKSQRRRRTASEDEEDADKEEGETIGSEDENKPVQCIVCDNIFHYTKSAIHRARGKNGGTPLPKRCEVCRVSGRKYRTRERVGGAGGVPVELEEGEVVEDEEEEVSVLTDVQPGQSSSSNNLQQQQPLRSFNQPVECNLCNQPFRYSEAEIHGALGKNGGTPLPKRCEACRVKGKHSKNKQEKTADINFATDEVVESLSQAFRNNVNVSSTSAPSASTSSKPVDKATAAPSEKLATNVGGKAIMSQLTRSGPAPAAATTSTTGGGAGVSSAVSPVMQGPFSSVSRNGNGSTAAAVMSASLPSPPALAVANNNKESSAVPPPPLVPVSLVRPQQTASVAQASNSNPSAFAAAATAFAAKGNGNALAGNGAIATPPLVAVVPSVSRADVAKTDGKEKDKSKMSYQELKELEFSQRRHPGEAITYPTKRRYNLSIYCGGGKLCGAEVLYRLDHAPAHCPGTPSHICNWKAVRCVHCRFTWEEDHVRTNENGTLRLSPEIQEMFTHHYCLNCRAGVHGGISNQYGIILH